MLTLPLTSADKLNNGAAVQYRSGFGKGGCTAYSSPVSPRSDEGFPRIVTGNHRYYSSIGRIHGKEMWIYRCAGVQVCDLG